MATKNLVIRVKFEILKGILMTFVWLYSLKFVTFGVTMYISIMIESIAHKGLRLLWEKNDASKLPAVQIEKIRRILSALNAAKSLEPLRMVPGYKLHPLSGELKEFWSVWVTGNYRIYFRFEDGNVFDINYSDYH